MEFMKLCGVFAPHQLELQSCCVFLPNDSLPSPSTIICGDIPGTVRSWYHNQASMPTTLVVCLPQISVLSTGHKYMEPLQELPFVVSRPILEEGDCSYYHNATIWLFFELLNAKKTKKLRSAEKIRWPALQRTQGKTDIMPKKIWCCLENNDGDWFKGDKWKSLK